MLCKVISTLFIVEIIYKISNSKIINERDNCFTSFIINQTHINTEAMSVTASNNIHK